MKKNNILGLYVAFYLAKFNNLAYANLGFGNQRQTHQKIGDILGIKPATIKNWRDEFDPLFEYRAGWYQRKLTVSRIMVVDAVGNLEEYSLRSIINDILNNNKQSDINKITSVVSSENQYDDYISPQTRGITGNKAEEYFIDWYKSNKDYFSENAEIKDVRNHGCGYDFEIGNDTIKLAIEIKGVSDQKGGILFTEKEWNTARAMKTDYYLVIVNNVNDIPQLNIINNPYKKLSPKRNIQTVIQVNWTVSAHQIYKTLKTE
ncbi:MAG: DUF3883 domain-containing protein [Bacteroidales bacterium]|jgi:hypothetical protein|nr:DUF3883 domain-containing protein [Bacteroidales bacterium]